MKSIAKIASWILIFFGVLFIWAAFGTQTSWGNLLTGLITVGLGFGLMWYANQKLAAPPGEQKVTYNVDLTGDVKLEKFLCQQCGGALSDKNVALVGGALNVTCPYCGAVYQIEEAPKW